MKKLTSIAVILVLVLVVAGCYQKFYCKLFRVELAGIGDGGSFSRELLDGKFGSFGDSELFIRIVALWDSNNKDLLTNTLYSVSVQQRVQEKLTDTLVIDSVTVTFRHSGESVVTHRTGTAVMIGDFVPEPRVKTAFRDITIPEDVDSIFVNVTVRKPAGSTPESIKDFRVSMSRYQGTVQKFGIRPKN